MAERDLVWDALVSLFGEPSNSNIRGQYNKATKLLKESGATADDIHNRHAQYSKTFPGAALTPLALANRWDDLRPASHNGPLDLLRTFYTKEPPLPYGEYLATLPMDVLSDVLEELSVESPYLPGAATVKERVMARVLGVMDGEEAWQWMLRRADEIERTKGFESFELDPTPELILKAWTKNVTKEEFRRNYFKLVKEAYARNR